MGKRRKPTGRQRKPTGALGPIRVGAAREQSRFQPIGFPTSKLEIERYVLNLLLSSKPELRTDLYRLVGDPSQNPESHFDFSLPTSAGEEYLDLMEVAPLQRFRGSYANAPGAYKDGDFADAVWAQIESKSKKYGTSATRRVHLLLYTTDWRFLVEDNVLDLIAFRASKGGHAFASIVYVVPMDERTGDVVVVYPRTPSSFADFDEAARRSRGTMLGDPTRIYVEPGGAVVIPLTPPPATRGRNEE